MKLKISHVFFFFFFFGGGGGVSAPKPPPHQYASDVVGTDVARILNGGQREGAKRRWGIRVYMGAFHTSHGIYRPTDL